MIQQYLRMMGAPVDKDIKPNLFEGNSFTETPFERKSCYDCAHLKAKISWWCMNDKAAEARGTRIPGVIHCPFWEPDYTMIKKKS